ncbi:MAG TPA: response regulator transcription factor [Solirubrobacterales bacterium]|nr:response regulator transcription factor [Solirubrobacterales bacterium]
MRALRSHPGGAESATSARIAIRAEDVAVARRLTETLSAAEYDPVPVVGDDTLVLVSAYRRLGGPACAQVRELTRSAPELVVIVVVEGAGPGDVRRALQAGAQAVVTEASIEDALLPSITAALAGQIVIPARSGVRGAPQLLTNREKQILGLVVMGMTNAAIASKLFLAESTVKSHLSSAFSKLGVSSRSEAATVILDPESGAGLGILTIPTK